MATLVTVSRGVPETTEVLSKSLRKHDVEVTVINPYIIGLHTDGHKVARFMVRARRIAGDRQVLIRQSGWENDNPHADDHLFQLQHPVYAFGPPNEWYRDRTITLLDGTDNDEHTVEVYHRVEFQVRTGDGFESDWYTLDSDIVPIHV